GAYALSPAEPPRAEPPAAAIAKPFPVAKTAEPPPAEQEKTTEVRGRVFAPDGKPVYGAKVVLTARKKADEYDVTEVATTDAEGRFEGKVPAAKYNNYSLVASADGLGADWIELYATKPGAELTLKLVKADTVIRGRVLTLEGK